MVGPAAIRLLRASAASNISWHRSASWGFWENLRFITGSAKVIDRFVNRPDNQSLSPLTRSQVDSSDSKSKNENDSSGRGILKKHFSGLLALQEVRAKHFHSSALAGAHRFMIYSVSSLSSIQERDRQSGNSQPGNSTPSRNSLRECNQCHRSKLVTDFQKLRSAPDGRHDWCRACVSTFRASQRNTGPEHLRLTVKEAWERSKACSRCGDMKELRDFGADARAADGIDRVCRGCYGEYYDKSPERQPVGVTSQVCAGCKELKPAGEYYPHKKRANGLQHVCKLCRNAYEQKRYPERKVSTKIPRARKLCPLCSTVRPAAEFFKAAYSSDGRKNLCKYCSNKWRLVGKDKAEEK